ncbi:uncharacterized protein LOC142820909 isoform X1 [Pelodiscus sinensis]|uniref:uncharacterized protein LOC142820909 isoform X1 n=1 Tax=Pelodiscus sinensis TaxID=13735 RepID=UPI003F6BC1F2
MAATTGMIMTAPALAMLPYPIEALHVPVHCPVFSSPPSENVTIHQDHSEPEEGQLSDAEDPQPHIPPADCSSSSPDEAVIPEDAPLLHDLKQFQDLFKRVTNTQEIQLMDVPVKKHRLLKNLRQQQRAKIALPTDEAIMEEADEIWQTPTSAAPASKRVNRKYFVPAKGLDFLFNRPQPNSLVVDVVQRRAKAPQYKNAFQDKDNKKLDVFGRKVYSSATLLLRIANYMAHLSNHNFDNYLKFTELLQYLPDAKKPLLKAIVQEGYIACNTTLQMAMDVADTAAWAMATGLAMRRSSWLSSAGAPRELQNKVEDLPFDKQKLFASNTDEVLHSGKDSRTTLHTLGMYTPRYKCKRYYPYQRRYDYAFNKNQPRTQDDQRF